MDNLQNEQSVNVKKFTLVMEKTAFANLNVRHRRKLYQKMNACFKPTLDSGSYKQYFLYPEVTIEMKNAVFILEMCTLCLEQVVNEYIAEMECIRTIIDKYEPIMEDCINRHNNQNIKTE
jgi:hypothetical protein